MMDGMCRMMGGMMCGWPALVVLVLVLGLVVALIVVLAALARRGGGPRAPGPHA